MKKILKAALVASTILFSTSCSKDFLEVAPTDAISKDQIFSSVDGAYVALNGIYRNMYTIQLTKEGSSRHHNFGEGAVHIFTDLRGEDLYPATGGYGWFNDDYNLIDRSAGTGRPTFVWRYYYSLINNANEIIANIDGISGEDELKNDVKGQALAIRAHSYFKLVQLFQFTYKGNESLPGVPLYTEPSVATTEPKDRSTVQEVYDLILSDLIEAETLLNGQTQSHVSHIDEAIVDGLLARVYLVQNEWAKAAEYATKARNGVVLSDITSGVDRAGRDNGWLWGLQINNEQQTTYASFFSHMDNTTFNYASLGQQKCINKKLYDHLSATDVRKALILDPADVDPQDPYAIREYMYYKFRMSNPTTWDSDYVMMKSDEMLFIEAEALAMLGQDANAATLLQEIVGTRDSNTDVSGLTGQALMDEIKIQRRIELWGEGHRLLDLLRRKEDLDRRDGGHNEPLAQTLQLASGQKEWILQIPQDELDQNGNIKIQND
ncbi:RagB/SusD family nutrient uptake outer membrane protein [Flammeovirga pacifica]|uniref:RagB/SusD family nutrient uptake outer membrane protein n=1 Tax=Flammeovirga pacifica TaxID=915059 RepID=A0A1S1Z2N6_FLAPC|nr:RagB/SusD family nutrient uptake outer membrane protein [Flammeovirga pacifica]OHX67487.1 hypothetical protein NH26_14600 [Flammeovirga pacifica]